MAAEPGRGVVPETGRTVIGNAKGAAGGFGGEDLGGQLGVIVPEDFPVVLAPLAENPMKRRARHHLAARAAAVAGVDNDYFTCLYTHLMR